MLRNPRGATSLRWLEELLRRRRRGPRPGRRVPRGQRRRRARAHPRRRRSTATRRSRRSALVPLGRERLLDRADLRPHTRDEAARVVDLAERVPGAHLELLGRRSVFASDEFYLVAGDDAARAATHYDSLDQAENGVGHGARTSRRASSSATPSGQAGHRVLPVASTARRRWGTARRARATATARRGRRPGRRPHGRVRRADPSRAVRARTAIGGVEVVAVENRFFGGNIKVAGLLTRRRPRPRARPTWPRPPPASCPTPASPRGASSTARRSADLAARASPRCARPVATCATTLDALGARSRAVVSPQVVDRRPPQRRQVSSWSTASPGGASRSSRSTAG